MFKRQLLISLFIFFIASTAMAQVWNVSDLGELRVAMDQAVNEDEIVLAPGTYDMGGDDNYFLILGIEDFIVRSEDPNNRAVINGNDNAWYFLWLRQTKNVIIKDLVIRNMTSAAINIDDADIDSGDIPRPWEGGYASGITLQNLLIENIGGDGPWDNDDGIKLSGVDDFTINNVEINNWGGGGSAIDMVGCHDGTIEDSLFTSTHDSIGVTGVVSKGGSRNITTRNNRFDLFEGKGVAVKLGGSTDGGQIDGGWETENLFRFWPGESGYEAKDITAECNTVIGGKSGFSYVNIDAGGKVQNNLIHETSFSILRILNESEAPGIVQTANGEFSENIVVIGGDPIEAVDIGLDTQHETFSFAGNQWFKQDVAIPDQNSLNLPSTETSGVYGVDPGFNPITLCGCNDLTHSLPNNQWQQISLPCDLGANNTVAAVFGDDDLGEYDVKWVVYSYDSDSNAYVELTLASPLVRGLGYWIIQVNNVSKTLDMPATATPATISPYLIDLATKDSAVGWTMIGHPFGSSTVLSNISVTTTSGACTGGCTLDTARNADIVHNEFWTFQEGSAYTKVGSGGQLDPWKGYWAATLEQAHGKEPKLVVAP